MKALLLAAVLLPACAGPTPFYADPTFTWSEQHVIDNAAQEWADTTHGLAVVDIVYGQSLAGHANTIVRGACDAPHCLGNYHYDGSSTITLDMVSQPSTIVAVTLHELGHYFHAVHTTDPQGIMFPSTDGQMGCLMNSDLRDYCKANGCDASTMKGCDR